MADYRVVLLASEGELLPQTPEENDTGIEYIYAPSGYEAAAEVLADPAMALIVDMPSLSAEHIKLMEIARSRGTELIGVGGFPAGLSVDDLSGMHLVAMNQLPEFLQKMTSQTQAAPSGDDSVKLAPAKSAKQHTGRQKNRRKSH
ncbi:MAG: hypothetical protein K8S55_06395 [Phycisphaerae bacterium]|nr:hypothetical protein [Phycisphaerae bacterium]